MSDDNKVNKVSLAKKVAMRNKLMEKIDDCQFQQVKHDLIVPSNRKLDRITFEEFKDRVKCGEFVSDLKNICSKKTIEFYCALVLGKINLDRDTFIKEYELGTELDDIEKKYNIPYGFVADLRDFYGIKRKGAGFVNRLKNEKPLTDEAKQIIIGSLLGDGTITKNGEFREKHSLAQENYLRWKADKIGHIVAEIKRYDEFDARYNKTFSGHSVRTIVHSSLIDLEKKFYDRVCDKDKIIRTKVIPEDISSLLNPFTLAIWFMDDGSTMRPHRHGVKSNENSNPYSSLCTDGFSLKDIDTLIIAIKESCGINAEHSFHYKHNKGQSGKVRIRFNVEETKKLFKMIRPHIHSDLLYKIDEDEYVKYYEKKIANQKLK